jgi:hypothetical protein
LLERSRAVFSLRLDSGLRRGRRCGGTAKLGDRRKDYPLMSVRDRACEGLPAPALEGFFIASTGVENRTS